MAGSLDERFRGTDNHGPDGCTQAFAETEGDGVEAGAVILQGPCARGDGFPEACAVQMELDVVGAGEGGDGAAGLEREDGAVEGVF